jgi:hypothetical protein
MVGDPPIVISDGSITIEFPSGVFTPDPTDGNKYKNKDKKIRRIEITGGGISFDENVTGNGVVIKIHYNNSNP